MGIVNRSLDTSEQNHVLESTYGLVATGATLYAAVVPFNSTLDAARIAVSGLSGSPTYDLRIQRFIVGTGATVINPGSTTLTGVAFGTSGLQSFLLASAGSTLVNLLAGDIITVTSGAANTAATNVGVAVVLQAIQDIRSSFGVV